MKKYYLLSIMLVIIAGAALVANTMVGTNRKADERVIDDLEAIENSLERYGRVNNELPESLDQLDLSLKNPVSSYEYESYSVQATDEAGEDYNGDTAAPYEICATFKRDTVNSEDYFDSYYFSAHKSGKHCFDREVFID